MLIIYIFINYIFLINKNKDFKKVEKILKDFK